MPYIGKSPISGGFHKLDALTASATATYALTLGSAAYFPETANQLLVSLNGVIQAPQDSFTVSGSNLVFDSALTSNDSIDFVVALGDVLGVGSVTDGAITTTKLGNDAVTKAKIGTTELDLATIKDSTGSNTAMTIDSSGNVSEPNKEYFHVDLTTTMTALADKSIHTVDFGGKGTVKYDTKSNFDSANDAYLLGSSDGVYLISFSLGIRSENMATEAVVDAIAAVFVATDGTTFVPLNGGGARGYDQNNDEMGSIMFSGSFIYKSTTATTKIIMKGFCNTSPDTYQISNDAVTNQGITSGTATLVGARCTFLSVVRIA